jgi:hypothetical protein
MSAPLVPSPLDYVGRRRFSFYPPVRNVQPNEWLLGTGSWSEVQIVNAHTGLELWIPRQYVGGVSGGSVARPVVELTNELEYAGGSLSPCVKRIIEMPHAAKRAEKPMRKRKRRTGPASVVGIKLEGVEPSTNRKLVKVAFGAAALCLLAALLSALARL